VNGRNYINDSSSFSTRTLNLEQTSASILLATASLNAATASLYNATASIYLTTASLYEFSASMNSYTASTNATITQIQNATASIYNATASIYLTTESLNRATASLYNFSASINAYTASNNDIIAQLYNETASLKAASASINLATESLNRATASLYNATASIYNTTASLYNFSASINNYTSSTNATILDIQLATASLYNFSASILNYTASNNATIAQIQNATASLYAFSASINAYTASNNGTIAQLQNATASIYNATSSLYAASASINAFSASVLNYTASQNVLNGTYATTGSNVFKGNQTISGSILLSGSIANVNYIKFNTSAGVTVGEGELAWNSSDGTLDLGMKGGNVTQQIGEEIFYEIRNETTSSILNGTSLYANGVTAGSGRITAAPFVADGSVREVRYLGLATENISTGVNGFVTHFGYVRGLDTRGTDPSSIAVGDENWSVGDILYAHPTVAGKLTNVKPKHEISVAIIIIRHQSTGILFVRPTSYGHINDIHDVNINTGSLSTGDLLIYDSGSDYWTNSKQLSGSYGLTGSLNATSLTGSLFGTSSHAVYADYINNLSSASFASTGSNTFIGTQTISGSLIATQGVTASLLGTASYAVQALSASYWSGSIKHAETSSYSFYAESVGGIISGSIVTTGSNNFVGNQTISGSLSVTGNLSVLGTASFTYVTASQLAISASFISVNVFEPAQRFGGLIVYDSGSSAATASFAWDSLYNHWVYQDVTGSTYSGGVFITGPINTGSLGNERLLTPGRIPKSSGGDHIDDSIINEISGSIGISGSLAVTGSFNLLQSIYKNQNTSSLTSGTKIISTNSTSSYTSAFYNYVLSSGANARAGQFITVWNGSSINYTDVSTTDIGNTLSVVFTASLSGGNVVLSTVLPSNDWTIKTNVNLL
jgi:hypothetical protein